MPIRAIIFDAYSTLFDVHSIGVQAARTHAAFANLHAAPLRVAAAILARLRADKK